MTGRPASRGATTAASALVAAAGGWVCVSVFVLDYSDGLSSWSTLITGGLIVVASITSARRHHTAPRLTMFNAALGLWLLGSSFWIDGSGAAQANNAAFGAIVTLLALVGVAQATQSD